MRGQSGHLKGVTNLAQYVALVELLRREIDCDANVFRPFRASHAGFAQDPAAEVEDQPHILGYRNDIDRRHRAARRMIPAQQSLAWVYSSRYQVDQRLIKQLEFFVGERLA